MAAALCNTPKTAIDTQREGTTAMASGASPLVKRYEYLWCRTFGHAWEEWHTEKRPEFGYYETVHCARCGMERYFTVDALGDVIQRRYDQPEGYKLTDVEIDRAGWRREMRRRGFWNETSAPRRRKARNT